MGTIDASCWAPSSQNKQAVRHKSASYACLVVRMHLRRSRLPCFDWCQQPILFGVCIRDSDDCFSLIDISHPSLGGRICDRADCSAVFRAHDSSLRACIFPADEGSTSVLYVHVMECVCVRACAPVPVRISTLDEDLSVNRIFACQKR